MAMPFLTLTRVHAVEFYQRAIKHPAASASGMKIKTYLSSDQINALRRVGVIQNVWHPRGHSSGGGMVSDEAFATFNPELLDMWFVCQIARYPEP